MAQQRSEYIKAWAASPLRARSGLKVVNRAGEQQRSEGTLSELLECADFRGRNSPALTVSDTIGTSTSTINSDSCSTTTLSADYTTTPTTISPSVASTPLNGSRELLSNPSSNFDPKLSVFQRSTSMFETSTKTSPENETTNVPRTIVCESDISPYVLAQMKTDVVSEPVLHIEEDGPSAASTSSSTTNISEHPPSAISGTAELTNEAPKEEPALVPPPIPPREPLRPSTVNARPAQRRNPLPSDPVFPPEQFRTETPSKMIETRPRIMSEMNSRMHRNNPTFLNASCQLPRRATRSTDINHSHSPNTSSSSSSSASSSSGSEHLNASNESDDVFPSVKISLSKNGGSFTLNCAPRLQREASSVEQPPTICQFSGGIKSVKFNASDLGIDDQMDIFWMKPVTFDLPKRTESEINLVREVDASITERSETLDEDCYEDLMESALEVEDSSNGIRAENKFNEEIRLMKEVFSQEVSADDCLDALNETSWDIHKAIKLIKLKLLLMTNLADKQQCKQALMFCGWNIQEASSYLLAPPAERPTLSIVDVGL